MFVYIINICICGALKSFNSLEYLMLTRAQPSNMYVDVIKLFYIRKLTVCPGSRDPPEKIF